MSMYTIMIVAEVSDTTVAVSSTVTDTGGVPLMSIAHADQSPELDRE